MQPMSSAERRQMHTFFDTDPSYRDLATSSRGQEPDRRMVVRLAGSEDLGD
jgi:spoIIIJ-associated protein